MSWSGHEKDSFIYFQTLIVKSTLPSQRLICRYIYMFRSISVHFLICGYLGTKAIWQEESHDLDIATEIRLNKCTVVSNNFVSADFGKGRY